MKPFRRFACYAVFLAVLVAGTTATEDTPRERGLVVERVGPGSALEKAGLRPGDVLYAWEGSPDPRTRPEAARGWFDSPFDALWLRIEQVPRGGVTLRGRRDGEALRLEVERGAWDVDLRPVLSEAELAAHRQALEEAGTGLIDAAVQRWTELAAQTGDRGETQLAAWWHYFVGGTWMKAQRFGEAVERYETALALATHRRDQALLHQELGRAAERQGELVRARAAYGQSLRQRAELGEFLGVAISEHLLGVLEYRRGQYEQANGHILKALELYGQHAAGSTEHASSLTGAGSTASELGDLATAAEYHKRALAIEEQFRPESRRVAIILSNLGSILWEQAHLDDAEAAFHRSQTILEKIDPEGVSLSYSVEGLGLVARARGNLETAAVHYRRSLEIRQRLQPRSQAVAMTLNNLGTVAWAKGDFESCAEYFHQALDIQHTLAPESLPVARSLNNLAAVYIRLGDLDLGEDFFRRALELRERLAPDTLDLAILLNNLGHLAFQRSEPAKALKHYHRALAIHGRVAPNGKAIHPNLNNLGILHFEAGRFEESESYLRRSLSILEESASDSPELGSTLHFLGQTVAGRGDLAQAGKLLHKALTIRNRLMPGSWAEAETLHLLGRLARQQKKPDEALGFYQQALDSLEEQIERLGAPKHIEAGFRTKYAGIYRDTVELLAALKRPRQAFEFLERFRAKSFLAMLAERDLLQAVDAPELLQERRVLARRYDKIQAKLVEKPDNATAEALRLELRQLNRKADEIHEKIRRTSPKLAALRYPEPLDLDGVRAVLEAGTVLLSFSIGAERSLLFTVDVTGKLRVRELNVGDDALRQRITAFRQLINEARPDSRQGRRRLVALQEAGRELYALLLAPAASEFDEAKRLLVLPDGPLHLLPWSALVGPTGDEEQYLVEWKSHHVTLSTTVYAELRRERQTTSGTTVVAFGDPFYPPRHTEAQAEIADVRLRSAAVRGFSFDRLEASRREVESIAAIYGGKATVYLGPEATEERAKTAGAGARYVHFATHGVLDDRFPLNSGLVLTLPEEFVEGQDNGFLQAWEVFESVRLDAELVVLSACESALGRELGGEGLIGLTRAFHYAGARSVLASLWPVDDASTAVMMERFHHHLKSGKAKDAALRAAQLELLAGPASYSAPYAWAAFQLHGDWR